MDHELERDGSLPAPPPPPAPSVQVAAYSVECNQEIDRVFDEDGRLESASGPLKRTEASKKSHRFSCRVRQENASSHAVDAECGVSGERADRARVIALAVAALVLLCAIAVGALGVLSASSGHVEDDRAIDRDSSSVDDSAYDANAVAQTREANEAVTGQFAELAANEAGELVPFVQRFMDDYDSGVDEEVSYGFGALGITAEELADALSIGLSASVISVDVYGSKAWVEVETTSKSLVAQSDVFATAVASSDVLDFADAEEYKAYLRSELLAAFDKVEPKNQVTMVVVERGEEGWELSPENIASLLGAAWSA